MSRQLACSRAIHAALVADDAAWARLELAGVQHVDTDGGAVAHVQEIRYCACGSTLARRVKS